MPWVRFTRDFDWDVPERNRRVTIAYKRGMKRLVRTACAQEAIRAGAAVAVRKRDGSDGANAE